MQEGGLESLKSWSPGDDDGGGGPERVDCATVRRATTPSTGASGMAVHVMSCHVVLVEEMEKLEVKGGSGIARPPDHVLTQPFRIIEIGCAPNNHSSSAKHGSFTRGSNPIPNLATPTYHYHYLVSVLTSTT